MAVAVAVAVAVTAGLGCERKAPDATPPAPAPSPPSASAGPVAASPGASASAHPQFAKVEFPEVHIRPGVETKVRVAWRSPPGTGVNEEAPFKVRWSHSDAMRSRMRLRT